MIVLQILGGSLIQCFATIFDRLNFDWTNVKFFFCDERKVPFSDADSTFGEYKKNFLSKVSSKINENQFVLIDHTLSGSSLVSVTCKGHTVSIAQ